MRGGDREVHPATAAPATGDRSPGPLRSQRTPHRSADAGRGDGVCREPSNRLGHPRSCVRPGPEPRPSGSPSSQNPAQCHLPAQRRTALPDRSRSRRKVSNVVACRASGSSGRQSRHQGGRRRAPPARGLAVRVNTHRRVRQGRGTCHSGLGDTGAARRTHGQVRLRHGAPIEVRVAWTAQRPERRHPAVRSRRARRLTAR